MSRFFFLLVAITLTTCANYLKDPQQIVDKTIKEAGGNRYLNSIIEFDFQNKHYITKKNGDTFSTEQIFKDSLETIRDVVSNKGHIREINGMMEALSDSLSAAHTASINSVINFALLSFWWNDPGVGKKYLGDTMIENEIFYKVEITRTNGTKDLQEVFRYWINRKNFSIGYLTLSINNDLFFYKTINRRKVDGIQFYDYLTYKSKDSTIKMDELELLFSKGELDELSKLELQNVVVK